MLGEKDSVQKAGDLPKTTSFRNGRDINKLRGMTLEQLRRMRNEEIIQESIRVHRRTTEPLKRDMCWMKEESFHSVVPEESQAPNKIFKMKALAWMPSFRVPRSRASLKVHPKAETL